MIIYSSPKTGKTTFCNKNQKWIDSDKIIFNLLEKEFNIKISDDNTKGQQIIELFKRDRNKAEQCYTKFMYWLKDNRTENILLGTRRFMWLADKIYLETNESKDRPLELINSEIESAMRWDLKFKKLNKKYISQIIN